MKTFNLFGDVIGGEADRWDYSEVTPAQVAAFLKNAGGEAVEVNINSNGGSVTGGIAIANMLKAYPGEVTCNVLGVAASIASVIACAGKTLAMGEGSFLMVHNPFAYTSGTAEELRKDADTLDKMRDAIIAIYKGKCGDGKEDELKMLMDDESWLSRDEARKFGFAVEDYAGELKAAASLTRRAYDRAPEAVKAMLKFEAKKPAAENAVEGAQEAPEAQAEAPAENPAPAEGTQQSAANEAVHAGEVLQPTAEYTVPEKPAAPAPEEKAQKPADNWEARFKGLSTKYNALNDVLKNTKADYEAKLSAITAERDNLKSQLDQHGKDLDAANAKLSELTTKVNEGVEALAKANGDLAEARNSLTAANERVAHLESTRDLLTAGVLTPPAESSYKAKMANAKTPEEREALRAQKKAGKIN